MTTASGDYSTAIGYKTTASGQYSTAIGSSGDGEGSAQMLASGYSSVALGGGTKATNNFAIAMGSGSHASGVGSTAMGLASKAYNWGSTAMGWASTASGDISTAIGYQTEADGYNTTAIGSLNTIDENSSPSNWSYTNRAFVIGNGGWDSGGNFTGERSDAFTVLFDGTTNIAGSVTAASFIGDGSQLTNLPTSGISPFSLNDTSGNGIESETNVASGNYSTAMGTIQQLLSTESTAMGISNISLAEFQQL